MAGNVLDHFNKQAELTNEYAQFKLKSFEMVSDCHKFIHHLNELSLEIIGNS